VCRYGGCRAKDLRVDISRSISSKTATGPQPITDIRSRCFSKNAPHRRLRLGGRCTRLINSPPAVWRGKPVRRHVAFIGFFCFFRDPRPPSNHWTAFKLIADTRYEYNWIGHVTSEQQFNSCRMGYRGNFIHLATAFRRDEFVERNSSRFPSTRAHDVLRYSVGVTSTATIPVGDGAPELLTRRSITIRMNRRTEYPAAVSFIIIIYS